MNTELTAMWCCADQRNAAQRLEADSSVQMNIIYFIWLQLIMTIISSLLNVLHYCSCFYRHNKVSGIVLALPATPKSMELSLLSPPRQSRCNCPCFSPPHQSRWNCPCFLRHTKVGGISLLSPPQPKSVELSSFFPAHWSRWNCPCFHRHTKVGGIVLALPATPKSVELPLLSPATPKSVELSLLSPPHQSQWIVLALPATPMGVPVRPRAAMDPPACQLFSANASCLWVVIMTSL